MRHVFLFSAAVITCWGYARAGASSGARLDVDSQKVWSIPALSAGAPGPGKRVKVAASAYEGADVFHTLYLPESWKEHGRPLPIVFEYTGNYYPQAGSTGEPEDAGLGFGLCGGKYIWVCLPYVSKDHTDNAVTWWGDEKATVAYAKTHVPRIIKQFNADPTAVFLCGFSRGAIGVNYIGLHDDEIARLWTAFVTHDHFDGVREWRNTPWGSPLAQYREGAMRRLTRVAGRPYLVSQHGQDHASERHIRSALPDASNFSFITVDTAEALGRFPNRFARAAHNDRWLLKPSPYRRATWQWMNDVARNRRAVDPRE